MSAMELNSFCCNELENSKIHRHHTDVNLSSGDEASSCLFRKLTIFLNGHL